MTFFIHIIPEWLELAALTFCIGLLGCRLWVSTRSANAGFIEQEHILDNIRRLLGVCMALMFFGSGVNLIWRAAEMSGRPLSTILPVLPRVIFHTHLGGAWFIRIVALVLLSLTLLAGRRLRNARGITGFMLCIAVIIAMTESASGHASDKGDFSILEITDFSHLLAASAWGGGLLALSLVILPNLARAGDQSAALIADIACRFSRIAGIAVGIIAITALYNAWAFVGSFESIWTSPYGWTVFAKVILFSLLISLGAFNRYVSVPLLLEWGGTSRASRGMITRAASHLFSRYFHNPDGLQIALRFKRNVKVEAMLMLGVLLCAAMLRHEIPALHHSHIEHERQRHAAKGPTPVVSFETEPSKITAQTPVTMTVRMKDPDGRPLQGLEVSHERILHAIIVGQDMRTFAHIHPEDAGPITREMMKKADFPLHFTFPKAGEYLVGADFFAGDEFYSRMFHLSVSGKPAMEGPTTDFSTRKNFGEYRVTMSASPANIKAGEETSLSYIIEKNEKTVTDLNPYLGAAMHIAVVSVDLKQYIHVHGSVPGEPHDHQDHMHTKAP